MPLYEYQCRACQHRFELIRKFSDAPVTECPSCGGEVEKLVSSPAIRFKGSGFYITDYASKAAPSESTDSKSSSGSDSSSSKSESTSDAKSKSDDTKGSAKPSKSSESSTSASSSSSSSSTPAKSDGGKSN